MTRNLSVAEPRYGFVHVPEFGRPSEVFLTMDRLSTYLAAMPRNDRLVPVGASKDVWGPEPINPADR